MLWHSAASRAQQDNRRAYTHAHTKREACATSIPIIWVWVGLWPTGGKQFSVRKATISSDTTFRPKPAATRTKAPIHSAAQDDCPEVLQDSASLRRPRDWTGLPSDPLCTLSPGARCQVIARAAVPLFFPRSAPHAVSASYCHYGLHSLSLTGCCVPSTKKQ